MLKLYFWNFFLNPVGIERKADVNTRSVGSPTAGSPAHDASQEPGVVHETGKGASGITLKNNNKRN